MFDDVKLVVAFRVTNTHATYKLVVCEGRQVGRGGFFQACEAGRYIDRPRRLWERWLGVSVLRPIVLALHHSTELPLGVKFAVVVKTNVTIS